ncbi:type IV-A pilus assembly ATPase PilB [candidate division WOR-3 bacterium]|jgi:type IV pilus assembly protein PilB|nr:type IV-A pilus assembly ATPase PilB [candidate division WOR-3 bacterium]
MKRIGQILIEAGKITPEQLENALNQQKKTAKKLGAILIEEGYISESELARTLSQKFRVPSVDIRPEDVDPKLIHLIPPDMAQRHQVFPVNRKGRKLILGMVNPGDISAIDAVEFKTGFKVEPVVITFHKMKQLLEEYYPVTKKVVDIAYVEEEMEGSFDFDRVEFGDILLEEEEEGGEEDWRREALEKPVIKLVNYLITSAVRKGASDIHFEPYEKVLRVRFRIDGVLQQVAEPPQRLKSAIATRVKIMTGTMDASERRLTQDGRIKIKVEGKPIDIRVSIIPTVFGEKVVMRILDPRSLMLNMTDLGFEHDTLERFLTAIDRPYGLILVTGPTGSGKSTTLYSALSRLNSPEINLMTVENPVEYNIKGINQVQVNPAIGFSFPEALRAFLRQSPNVILVGEIREIDTASIAIRAALTGHLVLSTLHTNDAPSSINRLTDIGIKSFLIASSLNLIQAQRLLRKVCPKCKKRIDPSEADKIKVLQSIGLTDEDIRDNDIYTAGEGCQMCNSSGYKGRIAITEVMPISMKLREMILHEATTDELRDQASKEGMKTLREDALLKLKKGITTPEEILRVTVQT